MLAKMALELSHTTHATSCMSFQGMLATGVRFRFNKFPPSNMQWRAIAPIIAVENCLQVKGLTYWEGFGQMMRGVGIFPVGRQKIPKMIKVAEIVGKLKIFFLCSLKDLLRAMYPMYLL